MRILHIENDQAFRELCKEGLEREGFAVDGTPDAKEGIHLARKNAYDVILIDLLLPGGVDGHWVIRTLRHTGYAGALFMMSEDSDDEAKVRAFENGADDYLVKPVSLRELAARIRRFFSRQESRLPQDVSATVLKVGPLELNLLKHRATRSGQPIYLTPKEFMVLECLMRRSGQVITQSQLAQAVWDCDFVAGANIIETHINRLRKKIDEEGKPSLIQTVRGSGYMIEDQSSL